MKKEITVVQFGLGPIGVECLKLAESRPRIRVIGAVDIDPAKAGADLGKLTGAKGLRGVRVSASPDQLDQRPDLVFHTAVSRFRSAYPQIEQLVRQGINVVSSCEELLFPQLSEPRLASKLDRLCRQFGARVVGTGVNPGFVMDFLPACLATVSREIRSIHIQRVVNASTRRGPLQRKIGSGLAPEEFERRFRSGEAGHAGLKESLALLAHALGWELPVRSIREAGQAIVAKRHIQTEYVDVLKGQTCGLHQRAEAKIAGRLCLTLDLKMYLEAEDPHDAIQIEGDPHLELIIPGGVAGDEATVAALVNTAARLLRAQPGLHLATDLAVGSRSPKYGVPSSET